MPATSELPVPLFTYDACGSTHPCTGKKEILLWSTSWVSGVETSCSYHSFRFSRSDKREGSIRKISTNLFKDHSKMLWNNTTSLRQCSLRNTPFADSYFD
jgi:hypothetical protein